MSDDIRMEAAIIYDSHLPNALRRALEYAGDDGFVASMPQLLHARANASYDNEIWNTWFTSNSEESVVKTSLGHRVVVAVHGGGNLASRIVGNGLHRFAASGRVQAIVAKQASSETLFEGRCLADHQGYRGLLRLLPLDRRQYRGGAGGAAWRAAVARRLRMVRSGRSENTHGRGRLRER